MNYQKAIRYATKLIRDYNAPYNPRDLVHDAYLEWWKYRETDLFTNPEGTIVRTIKNKHFNNLNQQYYQKDGEKHKKINILVSDGSDLPNIENVSEQSLGQEHIPEEENTPETEIVTKENLKDLHSELCDFDKKVLNLKARGYGNGEIEKILDTHNLKIAQSVKNIKKVMHTKSPFNGCKVDVVKRVRRTQFEKEREKYEKEWEMGDLSDFNEFYVLMTSKTNPNEGLLIKEKGSD